MRPESQFDRNDNSEVMHVDYAFQDKGLFIKHGVQRQKCNTMQRKGTQNPSPSFTGSARKWVNTKAICWKPNTYLDETDSSRLFAEALTAEIEAVFTDKTSLVSAEAATRGLDGKQGDLGVFLAPLTAAFAEFSRTREPNCVVGHFVIISAARRWMGRRVAAGRKSRCVSKFQLQHSGCHSYTAWSSRSPTWPKFQFSSSGI
jgi:hypothetical protein